MRTRSAGPMTAGLILTLAIVSTSVVAQGPPGGPGGFGGPGMGPGGPGGPSLLRAPSVQAELGMTDKQKAQLQRLDQSMGQRRREVFQQVQQNGGNRDDFMEALNDVHAEQESSTSKILTAKQRARLAQLELQREGKLAIATRKDVATKLKLTNPQTKKVKAIMDEMRTTLAAAMPTPPGGGFGFPGGPGGPGGGPGGNPDQNPDAVQPNNNAAPDAANAGAAANDGNPPANGGNAPGNNRGRGGRGGAPGGGPGGPGGGPGGPPNFNNPQFQAMFARMRETVEKARASASKKIDDVLTKEQKAAFDKLVGKPFDFSTIPQGPGPGGPGGPGRPGGPNAPAAKQAGRDAS